MAYCKTKHRIILIIFFLFSVISANAHSVGESYLFMSLGKDGVTTGRFEFHKNDLKKTLGIELGEGASDSVLTHAKKTAPEVYDYIERHFLMKGDDQEPMLNFTKVALHGESTKYVQYYFNTHFDPIPKTLTFNYSIFYENDRLHRGLFLLNYNPVTDTHYPEEHTALIFNPSSEEHTLDLRETIPPLLRPSDFVWQGILHIWIGIDHILFLVVLLLPSVLRRQDNKWAPSPTFLKSAIRILKIVTLFTIAHSITLGLAALDYVSLSGRFVESMIAASIVIVALNNIFPKFKESNWLIIFGFGLFHGLGFASVMSDIPFRMQNLWKVLINFNIGVEIGQVVVVFFCFVILYAIRRKSFYIPCILHLGSALAALVATFWFIERAFGL